MMGATLLAALLTLVNLGDKSLWFDEAWGIGIIDRPLGDGLWRLAHWEVNMAPFNLARAGWWRLGQGEAFLRLLPALCAIAAVPALFALGRRLFDAQVAAVAALLLALHPLLVQWGQQLRAYSLVVLVVILASTLLLRSLERPAATAPAVAYAAMAALATYAHFFGALVVVAHGLWLLLGRPVPTRLILVAGSTYALLVTPLAWFLVTRDGDPLYWVSGDTGSAIVEAASSLGGGSHWGVAAYALSGAIGLGVVLRSLRSPSESAPHRWPALLAALWLIVPVVLVVLSNLTVKPLLEGRFLIVVVPAMALLAAAGVVQLGPRLGAVALLALVVASGLGVRDWYQAPSHEDWRAATGLAAEAAGPDGAIVVEPWGGVFAIRYYEDRLGTGHHPVLRPTGEDPPAGARLVEIRRQSDAGYPAPHEPGYKDWRDRYYDQVAEQRVEKLIIRTFELR
jgi:4-amino-4-deoxy-L-arabinose transferase-like glycosyltransferase